MRESRIEKSVTDHAKKNDWLSYKFKSANNRGVPDRIFLKQGVIHFVEFKATGEKPTKLQRFIHALFKQAGFPVLVIDDIDQGKAIFN